MNILPSSFTEDCVAGLKISTRKILCLFCVCVCVRVCGGGIFCLSHFFVLFCGITFIDDVVVML